MSEAARAIPPIDQGRPADLVANRDDGTTLGAAIGTLIRHHRTKAGMSGVQLAANAGISQPFLSQLESGRSSVGIATLYRIARALRVHPSDLLPSPAPVDVEIVRAGAVRRTRRQYTATPITRTSFRSGSRISELHDCRISTGDATGADAFSSDGETILYVLEGTVRLDFEDRPEVILEEGDAACYSGRLRCRLRSTQDARIILIVADT